MPINEWNKRFVLNGEHHDQTLDDEGADAHDDIESGVEYTDDLKGAARDDDLESAYSDETVPALIANGTNDNHLLTPIMPASSSDWRKTLYIIYTLFAGVSMGGTSLIAGDLACYEHTRSTFDRTAIRGGNFDIVDYAIWSGILVHLGEFMIARTPVLWSRAGTYYDDHFGPSKHPKAIHAPKLTRLSQSIRQIGLADVSKFLYATSESFLFVGSSIFMFQGLFNYLFTTLLGLPVSWSWAWALTISAIQLPALVLNMLAFLHETDKAKEAKPLSTCARAGVIAVSTTTAVGSTLNDITTFISLYINKLNQVVREGNTSKISIYASIAFVSINAVLYRVIKQWYPRLSDYLPDMSKHMCGNTHEQVYEIIHVNTLPDAKDMVKNCIYINIPSRHYQVIGYKDNKMKAGDFSESIDLKNYRTILAETANAGHTPKEKSSWALAAELVVSLFKLITTFFNMLATLYVMMRLGMTKIASVIVGGIIALVVGVMSMISIASGFYEMPPKEKGDSTNSAGVDGSPLPRALSPSPSEYLLSPKANIAGYYTGSNPSRLFNGQIQGRASISSVSPSYADSESSSDEDLRGLSNGSGADSNDWQDDHYPSVQTDIDGRREPALVSINQSPTLFAVDSTPLLPRVDNGLVEHNRASASTSMLQRFINYIGC